MAGNDFRILRSIDELVDLRKQAQKSVYRQIYHVQSIAGLLNDPNGFIRHHGIWHLFYQWCPWGAVHGLKHWYHVTSDDLTYWKNEGIALVPELPCENEGAFSGTAWSESDGIRLFYAGNERNAEGRIVPNVCMAKIYDDGHVEKLQEALIPPHPDYTHDQRDPQILWVFDKNAKTGDDRSNEDALSGEGHYYMVMGARTKDDHGCLIVYRSEDIACGWQFVGQLQVPGYEEFGNMWECPAILRVGDTDVLMFCPQNLTLSGRGKTMHHNICITGHMDWERLLFQPEKQWEYPDCGFDYYAAQCAAGTGYEEPLVISAWMGLPGASYPTDSENWSGCLTIPRMLTVEQGYLCVRPVPALTTLRTQGQEQQVNETDIRALPQSCELEYTFQSISDIGIGVFTTSDGNGGIRIYYQAVEQKLRIDRSGMTKRFHIEQGEEREILLRKPLTSLRIYIDSSSAEIFLNDGEAAFTTRAFPTKEEHYLLTETAESCAHLCMWELERGIADNYVI